MKFTSPFLLPDSAAYNVLVGQHLPRDILLEEEWTKVRSPSIQSKDDAVFTILKTAQNLHGHPRLLHGLNVFTQPRYRIHCSTVATEVNHFVLIDKIQHRYEIYSFIDNVFTATTDGKTLQQLLHNWPGKWDEVIGLSPAQSDFLGCIAQVLQEILDDTRTEKSLRPVIRKRLNRLGKLGVLPLSVFIHFVDPNIPQYESMREYSTSGGFCDAHKITINNTPTCFRVLRQWESSDSGKEVYNQFCRELSVWQQLRHPNILPLLGATVEAFAGRYCFVVPWLTNGSIISYVKRHPGHDRYLAITQIVDGLDYLHNLDPPVGHKDIKGDNILVRPDLVCVITDFGLSSPLETLRTTTAGRGTQYWLAPEVGFAAKLSQDARPRDVYSLGCTMAEILVGSIPDFIWRSVIRGVQPELPPPRATEWRSEEREIWKMVKECIVIDHEQRPTIRAIKSRLGLLRGHPISLFLTKSLDLVTKRRAHHVQDVSSNNHDGPPMNQEPSLFPTWLQNDREWTSTGIILSLFLLAFAGFLLYSLWLILALLVTNPIYTFVALFYAVQYMFLDLTVTPT